MAGPGSPGGPCAPAAVWKRHIVRQLRHRDRKQKALFLELVPACECTPGGSGKQTFERGSPHWDRTRPPPLEDSGAVSISRFCTGNPFTPVFVPGSPPAASSPGVA